MGENEISRAEAEAELEREIDGEVIAKIRKSQVQIEMDRLYSSVRTRQASQTILSRLMTLIDKAQIGHIAMAELEPNWGLRFWMKTRGQTLPQAVVELAYALDMINFARRKLLLRELGIEGEDSEETVQMAIQSKKLVVRESPRAAYWNQEEIDVDWARRPILWEYFWELCRMAQNLSALDTMDLGNVTPRNLIDRKSKLINEPGFPATLAELIKVDRGHTLNVEPSDIKIFMRDIREEFSERQPDQSGPR